MLYRDFLGKINEVVIEKRNRSSSPCAMDIYRRQPITRKKGFYFKIQGVVDMVRRRIVMSLIIEKKNLLKNFRGS